MLPKLAFYCYIYAFCRRFYPKRLTVHSGYTCFFYQYVCSLGIEPTTFALLTQCSTTEPQEHCYYLFPLYSKYNAIYFKALMRLMVKGPLLKNLDYHTKMFYVMQKLLPVSK